MTRPLVTISASIFAASEDRSMRQGIAVFSMASVTLVLGGCVKVANDRYTINGRDVANWIGPPGSKKPLVEGRTSANEVRKKLGQPALRYGDNGETEIYVAPVGYRWVFSPWPVVLTKQAGVGDAPMLLRIDYDETGIIRGVDTKRLHGGADRHGLSDDVGVVWPELQSFRPVRER